MKIEVWSDFVCPFCYIGKRNMELAIEQAGIKEDVEIVYKSFQLNPNGKKHYDESIDSIIAKKYGMSIEQAAKSNRQIIEAAKQVGLDFNFDIIQPTNTFDAHRLSHYAKSEGKMNEYTEVLMKNYFTEGLNISDTVVLLTAIDAIGLDRVEGERILEGTDYSEDIDFDVNEATNFGINGVPFFVFDRKAAVSGAQPVEAFLNTFNKLSQL